MESFQKRSQIQLKGESAKINSHSYSFTDLLKISQKIGEGCVISAFKNCANVFRTANSEIKTKTKAPFPLRVKIKKKQIYL